MAIIPHILTAESSAYAAINNLKDILDSGGLWRPKDDVSFVFLCGANVKPDVPSARRRMIIKFSETNLEHTQVFWAENVFKVLKSEGHKKNILDVESDISQFADHIVIILESESAFCELGAFAVDDNKRDKIIVINDKQFESDPSFINKGPILAIKETAGAKNILYYSMGKEGKEKNDGIGKIFGQLYSLLDKSVAKRKRKVKEYNPTKHFNKNSIRLLHDMVYLMGPLYFKEINIIINIMFGEHVQQKIKNQLALLGAIGQIEYKNGLFRSNNDSCYFIYDTLDYIAHIATFKNMYYKHDKKRISWGS